MGQYWAIIAPTPSLQADHLPSTAVEVPLKPATTLCAPQRTFLPHVSPGRPVEVAAVARQRRRLPSILGNIAQYWAIIAPTPSLQADY